MTLTAHYFASRTEKYLVIVEGPSLRGHAADVRIPVAGKAEARKIAAARGAQPWNF